MEVGVLQFHLSYIFVSSDFISVIFSAPASVTATMRVIATVSVATCCCLFVDGQDTLCVLSSKPISRPFLSGLESDDAKQALMINKLVSYTAVFIVVAVFFLVRPRNGKQPH